jgi:uncharacterized protein YlxW (UPF0749 family)
MAVGWMSVLKMVPWGDVMEGAPKVAAGAQKLWQSVAKKPQPSAEPAAPAQPQPDALQAQVVQLQQAVTELQQQMRTSSELIESLAEQNTQLIARVEVNRRRLLGLAGLSLLLVVAFGALALHG